MNKFKIYISGGKVIESDKTLVMGILNATPDSFSDGGELVGESAINKRVKEMLSAGAEILDIGGESTRPGHKKVSESEELRRILPVIKTVRKISKTVPISVDTQKATVAKAALQAGASIINDVSALADKNMAKVAKDFGCSIILMRNKATGNNLVEGCRRQFEKIISTAQEQGLPKKYLLLDPGLGFGDLQKNDYRALPGSDPNANLLLVLNIDKYSHGLPVVIGASRKRFIREISGEESAKSRLAGSVAIAVMAEQSGAAIVRVHDVAETVRVFKNLY